jgi:hypothetical protein
MAVKSFMVQTKIRKNTVFNVLEYFNETPLKG